jgi:hypothetical protein
MSRSSSPSSFSSGDEVLLLMNADKHCFEAYPSTSPLKMMAVDNDDAYNLTPAFILETVAAAKAFVSKNLGNATKVPGEWGDHIRIASFLAWPPERVKNALAQLGAIEGGELSKKAVEILAGALEDGRDFLGQPASSSCGF